MAPRKEVRRGLRGRPLEEMQAAGYAGQLHTAVSGRCAAEALEVLADAVAKRDPRTRLLYVDVTALGAPPAADAAQSGAAMTRRLGTKRVLFGSDATLPNTTAGDAWAAPRSRLA